jgi:hypothetical protein
MAGKLQEYTKLFLCKIIYHSSMHRAQVQTSALQGKKKDSFTDTMYKFRN